jgi:hypothetical protein
MSLSCLIISRKRAKERERDEVGSSATYRSEQTEAQVALANQHNDRDDLYCESHTEPRAAINSTFAVYQSTITTTDAQHPLSDGCNSMIDTQATARYIDDAR